MKRTPLRPGTTPLARSPITRGTPIAKKNAKRKGHRFPAGVDEAYREWIRQQPCCVTGKVTGQHDEFIGEPDFPMWIRINVEAAHVKSRGASGKDRCNLVPLTWRLHAEQHRIGIKTFQEKYSRDLKALALAYDAQYVASRRYDGAGQPEGL